MDVVSTTDRKERNRALRDELLALEAEKKRLEVATERLHQEEITRTGLRNGRFVLLGAITEMNVHNMLLKMEEFSRANPGADIEIIVNSGGGSCFEGFALIDGIERLKRDGHRVTITGIGLVASMATVIQQAADVRRLGKNAWYLIHEVAGSMSGTVSAQENQQAFMRKLNGQAMSMYQARGAKITPAVLKRKTKNADWYLTAEEALASGFVDEVI